MHRSRMLLRAIAQAPLSRSVSTLSAPTKSPRQSWICTKCLIRRGLPPPSSPFNLLRQQCKQSTNHPPQAADSPGFKSIVDNPPILVRAGRRHNKIGLIILATIPFTAFFLGCWQVQRLGWKTDLIARFEDRLIRDPLPLPPVVDQDAVTDFDYRRVYARGKLQHEKEMLIGPRLHDGADGYLVVTPLDRSEHFPSTSSHAKSRATVLVNRGWISKDKALQSARPEGLPQGQVVVEGLLREPWKKNMFTPQNKPEEGKWYFPDVHQMAEHTGAQAIWIEETMKPDLLVSYEREAKGIPIGRPPEVNLRNNHTQYIFTWFSLSLATSIMLWMVVKKPASSRRIRPNKEW